MEKAFALIDPNGYISLMSINYTRKDVELWALAFFSSPDNSDPKWKTMYKIGWRIKPVIVSING